MKTKLILIISMIVILTISLTGCTTSSINTNNNIQKVAPNGETKTVKLNFESGTVYNPQEIRVKAGTNLKIEGDPNTLVGGMDTIIVDGYGVNKKVSEGDNILEFVADTPGEFRIHCQNQMGNGKLIVE